MGISAMGYLEMEFVPSIGDTLEIDGLQFDVVNRMFSPQFSDSGIYGVQIILHRQNGGPVLT